MKTPLTAALIAALALSGCSRLGALNPLGWFGRGGGEAAASGPGNPLIPARGMMERPAEVYDGAPIGQITALRLEALPGGAVLTATGVADRPGAYAARLTPRPGAAAGELVFDFEVKLPQRGLASAPQAARTVTAAIYLSDTDLAGVRRLRVNGARNAQALAR